MWLENDSNDLGYEILNDNEIVESVKETELSSENENILSLVLYEIYYRFIASINNRYKSQIR